MSTTTADTDTREPDGVPPKKSAPKRRRSRIWRVLKWTLLVLLVLIVLVVGLVTWVATTNSGLAFAWSQIGSRLPQGIEVTSVKGRLIGPLEVRGVKVDTPSMHAAVKAVDLDWDASELFSATVHINNLAVRGVNYQARKTAPPKPKKPSKPFSLPKTLNLPVAVQIDRVTVDNVSAATAPGAKPLVIDRARLVDARLDNDYWRIKSLTGHGPLFDIDADARVKPGGGYATSLNLNASLRPADLAPVKVNAKISGDLDKLAIAANVDAPYNIGVNGQVKNALTQPAVDATVQLTDMQLAAIKKTLPKTGLDATLNAKGPIQDLGVDLDARIDSAQYGKANITAAAQYTPAAVTVKQLKLSSPDMTGRLSAQGQVAMAKGNAMDLTVDWSALQWPLAGKAKYRSKQGTVKLTGTMDDYNLDTDLTWQVVGQAEGKLSLTGSGSTKAFDLASLHISGGPGDITGRANLAWAPALKVKAHLAGHGINPGALVANVPGNFDLAADLRAKRNGKTLTANIDTLTANGRLRGQPLHLNAKAAYAGDHIQVDTFDLQSGATQASLTGRFGWTPNATLDGRWSIDSSDLATLWPSLAGTLKTSGSVAGKVKAPDIDADLDARHIAYADNRVDKASVSAKVDWSGRTQSKVDINVHGVDAAGQKIKSVALRGHGTPASHTLTANVDSALAQADIGLDGHLNKKTRRWGFTLNRLRAAYKNLAPWTLAAPASGSLSAKAQSIDDACLTTTGDARLCITGAHDAKLTNAHIALSDLSYTYAKPFIPDSVDVSGALSGSVDARLPAGGDPDVEAHLTTSSGSVHMTNDAQRKIKVVDMQPGHIDLTMHHSALDAQLALPLAETGDINARIAVAAGKAPLTERPLDGTMHLHIAQLAVLAKMSSQLDTIKGHIDGDLNIGGTIAKPRVLGNIALDAPRIVLVGPGLVLTGVKLAAVGHGDSISIDAGAKSGGGSLSAKGRIALNDTGQDVDLAISGKRFQAVNIPDVTAYVSPDLHVKVTPSRVDVTGSVTIPKASITPKNLPAAGVDTVSDDQVIVTDNDKNAGEKAVARAIHANVKVIMGDKVHIEGFGLKADLGGNLRVVQQPGGPPTGTGAIDILNGEYRAYNQSLDIQKGRIVFAGGPVSQPGLNIRAARYPAEDITVGVQVRGSVHDPKVTLFSDPTMSQSEQLSWLLLGRPLEGTTGKQASLVARAALALGSSRGNKVLKSVGNKLGLDTVSLGAGAGESSDQAALTVGKYLSPKLYVSYGIGLFNPVSTLSMRYTLSSHWRLETQSSGAATGGDLIYSIDR